MVRVPAIKARPRRPGMPFWVALLLVPVVLPVWLVVMAVGLTCKALAGLIRWAMPTHRC